MRILPKRPYLLALFAAAVLAIGVTVLMTGSHCLPGEDDAVLSHLREQGLTSPFLVDEALISFSSVKTKEEALRLGRSWKLDVVGYYAEFPTSSTSHKTYIGAKKGESPEETWRRWEQGFNGTLDRLDRSVSEHPEATAALAEIKNMRSLVAEGKWPIAGVMLKGRAWHLGKAARSPEVFAASPSSNQLPPTPMQEPPATKADVSTSVERKEC